MTGSDSRDVRGTFRRGGQREALAIQADPAAVLVVVILRVGLGPWQERQAEGGSSETMIFVRREVMALSRRLVRMGLLLVCVVIMGFS